MTTPKQPQTLAAALLAVQGEIGNATKSAANPFFKSKYADLNAVHDAVLPVMTKHGVQVQQSTGWDAEGRFLLSTVLSVGDDAVTASWPLPTSGTPQEMGSALTYARRYTLQTVAGIGAEDDDGNAASKRENDFSTVSGFGKFLVEPAKPNAKTSKMIKALQSITDRASLTNWGNAEDTKAAIKALEPGQGDLVRNAWQEHMGTLPDETDLSGAV
jgi:hypothetical protein|tara:strand:+ start:3137 stop:3781 length:645 start_codon:yes stop_codon:yes gene_type:complete